MTKKPHRKHGPLGPRWAGIILLCVGLVVMIIGQSTFHGLDMKALLEGTWANLGSELMGIAITVLLIDSLNERREDRRLQEQLVRELGSSDNGLALRALRELRARNWLTDSLVCADLSGADLSQANFERVDLRGSNFAGARLWRANLSRSQLTNVNFSAADLAYANLEMANAEGANFYDARMNQADMAYICLKGASLNCGTMRDSDLTGADLTRADMRGADLTGSRLDGASMEEVQSDSHTLLPAGYEVPGKLSAPRPSCGG